MIQYCSDLHLEFGSSKFKYIVMPEADVHVFAGDIHTNAKSLRKFFVKVRQLTPKPLIYVYGNHEFYDHDLATYKQEYERELEGVVTLLDNSFVEIDGVRFLGTGLYTDLSNPIEAITVAMGMTDFNLVQYNGHKLTPQVWDAHHRTALQFLEDNLRRGDVVVTHTSPSYQLCAKQYRGNKTSAGYHTELYYLIEKKKPALWIYGHDHNVHQDKMIANTRCVCNQRGYNHEQTHFAPRVVGV